MTRIVSVIAFVIGMVLAWGFPVMLVAAAPGFVWGTAELIETNDAGNAVDPQVATDAAGNAVAVWEQSDGTRTNIWANRFVPGLGWGTATLIETDAGGARVPQVAVDPQGNATALWMQSDGTRNNIWANGFVPGLGWGTATLIETDAGDAGFPQVAVDPQGNATAVWVQLSSIWANRFVPGVGWGTATLIETGVGPAGGAQVAVDPQGNAVAVWPQSAGTRFDIWANRGAEDVPPDLVIASPADGAMLPSTMVPVSGTASDDVDVDKVELSTDGTTWVLATGTTSWSGALTLAEGANTIFARATDTAGNTAIVSIAVTVDTAKPTVAITSPSDGATLGSTSVTVSGTASDNEAVDKVELSLEGTTYVLVTGTTSWSGTLTLVEGSNTIFARATDSAGNTATVSIAVTVDTAKPTVAITSPSDGATLPSIFVLFSGTASDNVAVEMVELSLEGTNYFLVTGTTSWSGTLTLVEGSNTIFARATDTAGNTATVGIDVTVNTVNPTVTITSPADGADLASTSVTVSGTAFANGAVDMVELSTDGTTYVLAAGTASWSGTLTLVEGSNTIFARATDTAGNTATVSIAVTVDIVMPMAVAGGDQTANVGDTVSFDASASSDDAAIVSYEWDFGDGTTGTGETATHVYSVPGTFTVTLTVEDTAGNADTDVLVVTVETESVNPISIDVVTLGVVGVVAAAAAGAAFLLWRRRAGGKEKA